MKVAELEGALLDYWVAQAKGDTHVKLRDDMWFRPSSDWAQGGPIIERDGISLLQIAEGKWSANSVDWPSLGDRDDPHIGETPLVAAMRAFVASVYGLDVPDTLPA
jgi:hypothetical protein